MCCSELSQKQLGISTRIDEFSVGTRINQYERAKPLPDLDASRRLADVLGVSIVFLYCCKDGLEDFYSREKVDIFLFEAACCCSGLKMSPVFYVVLNKIG